MNSALRDMAIGRRLARSGARRIIAEAEQCKTNKERTARWRNVYSRIPFEVTIAPIKKREVSK